MKNSTCKAGYSTTIIRITARILTITPRRAIPWIACRSGMVPWANAWPGGPVGPAALDALVATCDEISRRWTPRQARVVALRLQPDAPSQSEIGGRFGISQQMVAKHLQTGGDWALRRALAALEGGTSHDE
jgi:hypothetical protein